MTQPKLCPDTLEAELARLIERDRLRTAERELMLHDKEVNSIVQRRLERGEWLLAPNGFIASGLQLKDTNHD